MIRRKICLAATLVALHAATAMAAGWVSVAGESRLQFIATYQGQQIPGVFRQFHAYLDLYPDKPFANRLEVSVVLKSADMNSADINRTIQEPAWFKVIRFPRARFESSDIKSEGANRFLAKGTLALKGMKHEIAVPFVWSELGQTATMQGELVIRRADFGIGTGQWVTGDTIGLDVTVRFDVKLERKG